MFASIARAVLFIKRHIVRDRWTLEFTDFQIWDNKIMIYPFFREEGNEFLWCGEKGGGREILKIDIHWKFSCLFWYLLVFISLLCSENLLRYIAGANIYFILKEKFTFKEQGWQIKCQRKYVFLLWDLPCRTPCIRVDKRTLERWRHSSAHPTLTTVQV